VETIMAQSSDNNPYPALNVGTDGTVLYSNAAGVLLLHEWGTVIGQKLPLSIGDIVQRVISHYSPEKTEIKVGNRNYLVVFSPSPEQECVSISGFDISDHKGLKINFRKAKKNIATSLKPQMRVYTL
jgi:hypothetical protein